MSERLGILVTSDKHLDAVVGISKAAKASGKSISIFLMDDGCLLAKDPKFVELLKEGVDISICEYNATKKGVRREDAEGIFFGAQYQNAVMAHDSDRYLVF
ncbi:MAG: DsrE family protein [Candidatus Hydrothermarchaeales archaeon]